MRSNADGVPRSHEASTGCPSFDEKRRRRSPAEPRGFNQMSTRVRAEGTSNQLGQQQVASSPPQLFPCTQNWRKNEPQCGCTPTRQLQSKSRRNPARSRPGSTHGRVRLRYSCHALKFGSAESPARLDKKKRLRPTCQDMSHAKTEPLQMIARKRKSMSGSRGSASTDECQTRLASPAGPHARPCGWRQLVHRDCTENT